MFSHERICHALGALAWLFFAGDAIAQQQGNQMDQPAQKTPVYKPPLRGAPSSRVGGGSRGVGDDSPVLAVIAPDHTGLTLQEQPTLYWYVSKKVPAHVEITVIDDVSIKPLLEKNLDTPVGPGIQGLRLKDYGINLQPGIEYRWHVAIVVDPNQRSNDIIASGTIKRIVNSESMRQKLTHAQGNAAVAAYAEEGIWYDAIAALMAQMDADPLNQELQQQYQALLQQVGLGQIAGMR
jgi:hypothetical protein